MGGYIARRDYFAWDWVMSPRQRWFDRYIVEVCSGSGSGSGAMSGTWR